jgi:hypothetical protein
MGEVSPKAAPQSTRGVAYFPFFSFASFGEMGERLQHGLSALVDWLQNTL